MFITRTGRVLAPGQRLSLLTPTGFTEGVLDTVTLDGTVRLRSDEHTNEVALDDIEGMWALS